MNLRTINRLASLRPQQREYIGCFMSDRKLRLKVVKKMQDRGIGIGVDHDNIAK